MRVLPALILSLLAFASASRAQTDEAPVTYGDYSIAEVHFGWEAYTPGWHGGGNYVQAKTTDGKYFVYYINHTRCTEAGASMAMALLLTAKSDGSKVRFVSTKRAGDGFRFRDIQVAP